MKRLISDLFQHKGSLYVYCSSFAVKKRFEHDLIEQGFRFGDGVSPSEREIHDLMSVDRDYTLHYCGFIPHVQFGSLQAPIYCRRNSYNGCTRIDYARFISGEDKYVILGQYNQGARRKPRW